MAFSLLLGLGLVGIALVESIAMKSKYQVMVLFFTFLVGKATGCSVTYKVWRRCKDYSSVYGI